MMKKNYPTYIQQDMIDFLCSKIDEIRELNVAQTVSEWAEQNRSIGKGLTANPGPFSWTITPHNREIADCLSDSSQILEVYVIKPTQVGFTVGVTENHIGYCIEHGIGPLTYMGGDQTMAEQQMQIRIDEMIHQSGLKDKIKANVHKKKGKSTGDTTEVKQYSGTFMRVIGPNSESKAASLPARILHLDEMDKYPVQLAQNGVLMGDIVEKACRRTDSYKNLKKVLGGSTPKEKSISRIEPLVESGDMRYYNIKCKECDNKHPLLWTQFKWDKTPDGKIDYRFEEVNGKQSITKDPTYHECPFCGYKLREKDKWEVMQEVGRGGTAEWIPTKKADKPFVRSYLINGLMGQRTWLDIALQFLEVKDDMLRYPDFVNDVLGETFAMDREKPEVHELLQVSREFEQYPRGHIPKDVIYLTLACDVQADRLEYGVMGHCRDRKKILINYWVSHGNPSFIEDDCWKELEEKIRHTQYRREDGIMMGIQYAGIDSQYLSSVVDFFCAKFDYMQHMLSGVFPIQSRDEQNPKVKEVSSNIETPVLCIADQSFKRSLYSCLKKRPFGPNQYPSWYIRFSHEYPEEFFKELTSEEIVPVKIKGVVKGYKIDNIKGRRNEALDITKYNLALDEYAYIRFFNQVNSYRKSIKQNEVDMSYSVFIQHMEDLLNE
jgi:phage terminase large subunit GpA-like protein